MRVLSLALGTYVHQHGRFPHADVWAEELVAGGYVDAADVVSERGFHGPPRSFTRSHFAYFELPADLLYSGTALQVYENPAHYADTKLRGGTFAAFADGHVEYLKLDELSEYVREQARYPHAGVSQELLREGGLHDEARAVP